MGRQHDVEAAVSVGGGAACRGVTEGWAGRQAYCQSHPVLLYLSSTAPLMQEQREQAVPQPEAGRQAHTAG